LATVRAAEGQAAEHVALARAAHDTFAVWHEVRHRLDPPDEARLVADLVGRAFLGHSAGPLHAEYQKERQDRLAARRALIDARLHVKLPWPMQAVQRLDRRVQMFDLPPAELLTHDPAGRTIDRTLTVEAYVAWRIAGADGVDRFLRTVGTPEQARLILGQRVGGRLGAVIGTLPMEEMVSVAEPAAVAARAERLRERLLAGDDGDLRALARDAYGIEVVDVRLRRFNYPPAVRPAITERIVSERTKKAAEYQGEGTRLAAEITTAAGRAAAMRE